MWRRKGRKRLAMDIDEEIHKRMAYWAKERNISITLWVTRAIYQKIKWEEKSQ